MVPRGPRHPLSPPSPAIPGTPPRPPSFPRTAMTAADETPVGETPAVSYRRVDDVTVIDVPVDPEFTELRDWFRNGIPAVRDEIGGKPCRLNLGVRALQLFDLRRIINFLRDDFGMDVTGLYVSPDEVWAYAERELKLTLIPHADSTESDDLDLGEPVDEAPVEDAEAGTTDGDASDGEGADLEDAPLAQVAEPEPAEEAATEPATPARRIPGPRIETPKHDPLDELLGRGESAGVRVHHAHRTLRSGTSIRFDGDVIVFADVNPGAQIIATGNVFVFGALRGMVHAGASGDESAIILGFDMRPTQLRLGRKIAISPHEEAAHGIQPTIARVRDGGLVLEPYRTRSTR